MSTARPRGQSQEQRTHELLIRLDERTSAIVSDLAELRAQVVTQTEFKPIRALVYGFVALALTGIITGLLALVIQQRTP